jgi:hypothetical protein
MTDITLNHDPVSQHGAGAPVAPDATRDYPASTLSFKLDVQGLQLTWTLRGTDESMASRLPRVLAYLQKLQGRLSPQAQAAVPPPLEEREDWCQIHQHAMVRQENSRGVWYSHRVPGEGYCKGRRKVAGA